jgi:hypothetical protein
LAKVLETLARTCEWQEIIETALEPDDLKQARFFWGECPGVPIFRPLECEVGDTTILAWKCEGKVRLSIERGGSAVCRRSLTEAEWGMMRGFLVGTSFAELPEIPDPSPEEE